MNPVIVSSLGQNGGNLHVPPDRLQICLQLGDAGHGRDKGDDMRIRVVAGVGIGVLFLIVAVIALIGAIEVLEYRAGAEAIAQAFLVPLTLFVFAAVAFVIAYTAWRGPD